MTTRQALARVVLMIALALPATAGAYHASDMIIGSTVPGGGTLTVRYDFTKKVQVTPSFVGATQTLFSGTDPGWDAVFPSEPPLYLLAAGTPVRVEITALDPGVSLKAGADTLDAVGKSHLLGTIDASGNGLHVHPEWRLVLPNGVTGDYHLSFRLTTTAPAYSQSVDFAATITNVPAPTTTTTSTSTSTSSAPSTTAASTSTSTSAPPTTTTSSTTTTSAPLPTTTSTTLLAPADLLPGTTLVLKTTPGDATKSTFSLTARTPTVTLGEGHGSADDPTLHGGSMRVASATAGFDDTYPLPAVGWKLVGKPAAGKGWRYTDRVRANGPITAVVVTRGRVVRVAGKGSGLGHTLGVDPEPVEVTLAIGGHRYCLRFGGAVKWKANKSFGARAASAPGACTP
ncbi:MAG TPA: hypothetical protein VMT19_02695 [Thermoanaerobaculaceae bacterium]|nr:hypothetical protein [Thermoanaerobaculaceae bacterium]